MPPLRPRSLSGVLAALGFLLACTGRTEPPPGATGAEIFTAQRCDLCHGDAGEGGGGGPALHDAGARWTADDLVEFFVRPAETMGESEALRNLAAGYPMPMGAYGHLSEEHLRTLAEWILTL